MLSVVIDAAGRRRIGELVRAVMAWEDLTGDSIGAGGRISRATVDRVKRGDPSVSDTTLHALGDVLELPRGFLLYVGDGDIEAIRQSGADPDLIVWTIRMMRSGTPDGDAVDRGESNNNQR
jgi:hypothetical protein